MSDKLLPIDRVAELDNVGIFTIYRENYDDHYFVMVELTMPQGIPTLRCLAMQAVTLNQHTVFNNNNPIVQTILLATPYEGGYGAAIHDFVLWWMYTNYGPSAVSIADRESVSNEAARVREIYAERKGSIDAFPIDKYGKKLTSKVDDDYQTHHRHGGFDVYPEYQGRRMANDPQAYKDWAVRLTDIGYKEIALACAHLLKMGEKILSFMESQVDTTKQKKQRMIEIIVNDADRLFANVYSRRYFEAQSQRIVLNDDKTFQRLTDWLLYTPPTLDKTKKTTQKLGSYTYNPRRRTRRRR